MEITFDGGKMVTAHIGGHAIRTDQSITSGGSNAAPSPFDLYLAAIGTCAAVYVKSFCDNRKISADNIKIIQNTEYDDVTGLPVSIIIDIILPADFPEKYRASVVSVAELCKVKKSIANPPVFKVISTQKQL